MTQILKQSTAVDVLIGPFVDLTDGSAAETGESPSVKLSKNGQTLAAKNDVTTPVHDADGYYNCELDATDTNTVGTMILTVAASANALPVRHEFQVLEEAIYDALIGASAAGFDANQRVDVGAVLGTAQTANDNSADINTLITRIVGTLAAGTHNAQTGDAYARLGAPIGASISADVADVPNTVWDEALSGHTTGGTAGKALNNAASFIVADGTCQATGQTSTNIRLASGESATDEIFTSDQIVITGGTGAGESALITAYDGTNKDCTVAPSLVTTCDATSTYEILPAHVHAEDLGATAKSDVNAEVLDVLNTDTFAEPAQGAPAATTTLIDKIGFIYKVLRNKKTATSTLINIYNDDTTTVDHKRTISDDGTTYTEEEIVTGP